MRSFPLCLAFIVSIGLAVWAGDYQVVYQEQIDGAEHYVNIDPILDSDLGLLGFVFVNAQSDEIELSDIATQQTAQIPVGLATYSTCNYLNSIRDTLYVYVLSDTVLTRYALSPDFNVIYSAQRDINFSPIYWASIFHLDRLETRSIPLDSAPQIQVSTYRGYYDYLSWCDWWEEDGSLCVLFSADLSQEHWRHYSTFFGQGWAPGDSFEVELVNEYIGLATRTFWPPPNECIVDTERVGCMEVSGDTIFSATKECAERRIYRSLFVDDFVAASPGDEIVVQYGASFARLDYWWDRDFTTACYSFTDGELDTVWQYFMGELVLQHFRAEENLLVGTAGRVNWAYPNDSLVMFVESSTGLPHDTIFLGRALHSLTFFETSGNPSVLNLVGRVHDTVFVYQFQSPTDVAGPDDIRLLPKTFTLYQNYPNPFNNATVISFDNHVRQHVSLKICNLLGQHVVTLVEKELPIGCYSFDWEGTDTNGEATASGIYLAELKAAAESSTIKLLLLK